MIGSGLLNIDMATLRTLRAVYRHNSFSAAAAELRVSQSTISYAVEKLRLALDDRLFVRQGGRLLATERCRQSMEIIDRIWSNVEQLATVGNFDPLTTDASISLSATFLSRAAIMPKVAQLLSRQAPNLHVRMHAGFVAARQDLLDGKVDLALTPVGIAENGVYQRALVEDSYVVVMDKANPLATSDLALEQYTAARHLVVIYGQSWEPEYVKTLRQQGINVQKSLSTADPADLPHLLPGTDLIAMVPSWIARRFPDNIAVCRSPIRASTKIYMYWTARSDQSPLNTWFRNLIVDAVASLTQEFETV